MDVGGFLAVAVVALMEAGGSAKVGSRGIGCDGAVVLAGESWSVVGEAGKGELADVISLCRDIGPRQEGGLFQVAVGEVPGRVVPGDQSGLDVGGKRFPPEDGRMAGGKQDSSHAGLGSVDRLE